MTATSANSLRFGTARRAGRDRSGGWRTAGGMLMAALGWLLLLLPLRGWPLGLGQISVHSFLNAPLDARIPLRQGGETGPISVRLAPPDVFDRLGLTYAGALSRLDVTVEHSGDGAPYIAVRSRRPLREPILDLVLEVRAKGARLFRTYSILLDPPTERPAPRELPAPALPRRYAVRPGDTLARIADDLRKGTHYTREQMMLALWRHNPRAFYRPSVNALKADAVLEVPTAQTLSRVAPTQARSVIAEQLQRRQEAVTSKRRTRSAASTDRPKEAVSAPRLALVSPSPSKAEAARADVNGAAGELRRRLTQVLADNLALQRRREALKRRMGRLEQQVQDLAKRIVALPDYAPARRAPAGAPQRGAPKPAAHRVAAKVRVAAPPKADAAKENRHGWITVLLWGVLGLFGAVGAAFGAVRLKDYLDYRRRFQLLRRWQ